jgi:Flp pilus assembly secretin CpaC
MYDNFFAQRPSARRASVSAALTALMIGAAAMNSSTLRAAEYMDTASVVKKITGASEKLELTTNSSRILTLGKNVPRVQVNNPELVAVTPLSATDVQISAKKAGVTQVNLWDEDGNIHTVDVMIYGDARELSHALQTQFPHSSIRVYRYSESLVLTGFVDRADHVGPTSAASSRSCSKSGSWKSPAPSFVSSAPTGPSSMATAFWPPRTSASWSSRPVPSSAMAVTS